MTSIASVLRGHALTASNIIRAINSVWSNIGANRDDRDWTAIMASADPLAASEIALVAMYQDPAYLIRNANNLLGLGYTQNQIAYTHHQLSDRLGFTYRANWAVGTSFADTATLSLNVVRNQASGDYQQQQQNNFIQTNTPTLTLANDAIGFLAQSNLAGQLIFTDGTFIANLTAAVDARFPMIGALKTGQIAALSAANIRSTASTQTVTIGTAGVDVYDGSASNTVQFISTGDSNDVITGGAGADIIFAGDGADIITGGAGADALNGGDGDDTFRKLLIADFAVGEVVNGGNGTDILSFGAAGVITYVGRTVSSVETLTLTANAANRVVVTQGSGLLTINNLAVINATLTINHAGTVFTGAAQANVNDVDAAGEWHLAAVGNNNVLTIFDQVTGQRVAITFVGVNTATRGNVTVAAGNLLISIVSPTSITLTATNVGSANTAAIGATSNLQRFALNSDTGITEITIDTTGTNFIVFTGSTAQVTDSTTLLITGSGNNDIQIANGGLATTSTINAANATGSLSLDFGTGLTTSDRIIGTAGNTDVLQTNIGNRAVTNLSVSGIELLRISAATNGGSLSFVNNPNFTAVRIDAVQADLVFGQTITLTGANGFTTLNLVGKATTASATEVNNFNRIQVNGAYTNINDTMTVNISNGGVLLANGFNGFYNAELIKTFGIENYILNITDISARNHASSVIRIEDTELTTLTVNSPGTIRVTVDGSSGTHNGKISNINVSGVTNSPLTGQANSQIIISNNSLAANAIITSINPTAGSEAVLGLIILGTEQATDTVTFNGGSGLDHLGAQFFLGRIIFNGGPGRDVLNAGTAGGAVTAGTIFSGGEGPDEFWLQNNTTQNIITDLGFGTDFNGITTHTGNNNNLEFLRIVGENTGVTAQVVTNFIHVFNENLRNVVMEVGSAAENNVFNLNAGVIFNVSASKGTGGGQILATSGVTVNAHVNGSTITGTDGRDILNGGAGIDFINDPGLSDNDVITGGGSGDTFFLNQGKIITDLGFGATAGVGGANRETLIHTGFVGINRATVVANFVDTNNDNTDTAILRILGVANRREFILNEGVIFNVSGATSWNDAALDLTHGVTVIAHIAGSNITGTGGADILNGGAGVDTLNGGGGADVITGGAGADTLNGSDGIDTVSYADVTAATSHGLANISGMAINLSGVNVTAATITFSMGGGIVIGGGIGVAGADLAAGSAGYLTTSAANSTATMVRDTLVGFEAVTGSALADFIVLGNGGMSANGGNGYDFIIGGTGDDTIQGDAGNDILIGGTGNDLFIITSSDNSDRINDFGNGQDRVVIENGANLIATVTADYTAGLGDIDNKSAATNVQFILGNDIDFNASAATGTTNGVTISAAGGVAASIIVGTNKQDLIIGGGANDNISGGGGNDIILGGNGDDTIQGDAGNDTITGGAGADRMTGGLGVDRFVQGATDGVASTGVINEVITFGNGVDVVTDFNAAQGDVLSGNAALSNAAIQTTNALRAGTYLFRGTFIANNDTFTINNGGEDLLYSTVADSNNDPAIITVAGTNSIVLDGGFENFQAANFAVG